MKKNPPEAKRKPFRFEFGWRGMCGLGIVCFFLFLWMFLLGIWAGQTILLPVNETCDGTSRSTSAHVAIKPKQAPWHVVPGK